MRILKPFAALAAGSLLLTGLAVATAGSASAADNGPLLPGTIYLLNSKTVTLDNATNANIVTAGTNLARPWSTIAVDAVCPAGTAQNFSRVRIPQVGVDPLNWDEVQFNGTATTVDAAGRSYNATNSSPMTSAKVAAYVLAQGGTATLPLTFTCADAGGNATGYFATTLTVVGSTSAGTWSVPAPAALAGIGTTVAVSASASSVEVGSPITLTAAVTPVAATGTVEFRDGAVSLGSAPVAAGSAVLTTSALAVGTRSVTAVYSGDATYGPSTGAPVSVTVTAVAPRSTTTVLAVSAVAGAAYQAVILTPTVTASLGAANGSVSFKDGAVTLGTSPCVAGVVAPFTTNVLAAGAHNLVAEFVGTAPYTSSTSAAVVATYVLEGAVDEQTVVVTIPQGAITLTTPYTPTAPLNLGVALLDAADSTYSASAPFTDIVITDTRAGNLGFTASVVSGAFTNATGGSFGGQYAGLTGLAATQVAGNALLATDLVLTNNAPFTAGLATPKVFAQHAAGTPIGTANLAGVFGIDGVPTSVTPGLYTATVTFTAV
jgi:hypothetical protein